MFTQMMLTALLAVTAENLLFAGGAGLSGALRAARNPGSVGWTSCFVAFFSLCAALAGIRMEPYLAPRPDAWLVRPAALLAAAAAAYLLLAVPLRLFAPRFFRRHAREIGPAAANTAVLTVPCAQRLFGFGAAQAAGYAAGTGAAFWFASAVLARALRACRNPDAPAPFAGLPAALIYIGILSMAFAGFTGAKVF
mgnify:FL=1